METQNLKLEEKDSEPGKKPSQLKLPRRLRPQARGPEPKDMDKFNVYKHLCRPGIVALDCEMALGIDNLNHLTRIAIVNYCGEVLIDEFIKPEVLIKDYRTAITGITQQMLESSKPFSFYRPMIQQILNGVSVVGHTLEKDFEVLPGVLVPYSQIREISDFPTYKKNDQHRNSLKNLTKKHLNIIIQEGEHSPVEDATAALFLFLLDPVKITNSWNMRFHKWKKHNNMGEYFDARTVQSILLKQFNSSFNYVQPTQEVIYFFYPTVLQPPFYFY